MAMAFIWTGMVLLSVVFAFVNGTIDAVGAAAMAGAEAASAAEQTPPAHGHLRFYKLAMKRLQPLTLTSLWIFSGAQKRVA